MPPIDKHVTASIERTGRSYKEVHEWLDADAAMKAERHDITRMCEFGKMIEEQYGSEAMQEYVRHLHDDVKAKFSHIQEDLAKAVSETLAYFGVK